MVDGLRIDLTNLKKVLLFDRFIKIKFPTKIIMAHQVQTDDIELSGKADSPLEMDFSEPVRFVYSLAELKQMREVFFVK